MNRIKQIYETYLNDDEENKVFRIIFKIIYGITLFLGTILIFNLLR